MGEPPRTEPEARRPRTQTSDTRINFQTEGGEWALDDVDKIDELIHLGEENAIEAITSLKESFLSDLASPYVPYT